MSSSEVKSLLGKKAASTRWAKPDVDDVARDLAAARIAAYIEKVVATAPPLTSAQKSRLSALIGGAF